MASEIVKAASPSDGDRSAEPVESATKNDVSDDAAATAASPTTNHTATLPVKAAPKSWADLVRSQPAPNISHGPPQANGIATPANGLAPDKVNSLAEALNSFSIKDSKETSKLSFLEPRGLVNTGNMCYMNSVSLAQLML